jgi:hypothetical protein
LINKRYFKHKIYSNMSEEVPAADAAVPEEAEKPEETKEGDDGAAAEDAN